MCPACANAPSISPATDGSSPENTSAGARPGEAPSTVLRAISSLSGTGSRHADASRYDLPSDRWLDGLLKLVSEHTGTDTPGPLWPAPLSRVEHQDHRMVSIAWRGNASTVLPCVGAPPRIRH